MQFTVPMINAGTGKTENVKVKKMRIMHDGVEIFCLPDNAFCGAGNGRPIEDIDECPRGWRVCEPANCIYYSEEPISEWIHFIIKDDQSRKAKETSISVRVAEGRESSAMKSRGCVMHCQYDPYGSYYEQI